MTLGFWLLESSFMAAAGRIIVHMGRRVLSRGMQTALAAPGSNSSTPSVSSSRRSSLRLLTKLLREPESTVKMLLGVYEDVPASSSDDSEAFWDDLLVSLRPSSPTKANLVLEWKLEKLLDENVRDHRSFSNLISLCGKLHNLPLAEKTFSAMESQGIHPNAEVFNSLTRVALSCGNLMIALNLFEIMRMRDNCDPDLSTYNAFIAMYSKRGNVNGMQGWYSAMKTSGFSPDLQTYESLVTGLVCAGRFDNADEFFEEMASSGIMPNGIILNSILHGLCRRKKIEEVKEFWKFLVAGGWEVDERMVGKIVMLYTDLGRVDEMEELVETLGQRPNSTILLQQVYSALIRLYASSNRLDDVEYSAGRMLKCGVQINGNSGVVETVISCYFRCEAYGRLDIFLERIGSSLSKAAYDLLVAGYRRIGLQEKLELVKKEMKIRGLA